MRNSRTGFRGGNGGSRYARKVEQRVRDYYRPSRGSYFYEGGDYPSNRYDYDEDYDDYYTRNYGYEQEEYEPEDRMYDYDDYVDEYDYGYDDFIGEDYKYYSDMNRFRRQEASRDSGAWQDIEIGDEFDDVSRARERYYREEGRRRRNR